MLVPIRGEAVTYGILGMNIDITERKQAERAVQGSHAELERRVAERRAELAQANEELAIFRRFAEASGEGFGMADLDGRIAYVNPTLARLFGEEQPADVIGQSVFKYYPQEYAQKRRTNWFPPCCARRTLAHRTDGPAAPRETHPDFAEHVPDSGRRAETPFGRRW